MQADRSLRSVFVGNIPYDATEEKLRDIFSAVGPVLSFRIVFDRETGKPKGYGFCEYKDQETATSAMRNLNGHDLGGRQLRVDSASNERARDEPDQSQQQHQQQIQQQQHPMVGDGHPQMQPQPQAEPLLDAQTVINNELCSLSPERLFDICKQLKASLAVNPNETRQLLVQNPQLSFAMLQTLVMIKAIDAQTAMNTLHKQLMQPAPLPTMMTMMQSSIMNTYGFVGAQSHQPAPQAQPMLQNPAQLDPRVGNQPSMLPNPNAMDPRMSSLPHQSPMIPNTNPIDPRASSQTPMLPNPNPLDPRVSSQSHQPTPTSMPPSLQGAMIPNPMDPRVNVQPSQIQLITNTNLMDPRVNNQSHQQPSTTLAPNPMDPRQSQTSALDPRLNPADPRLHRLQ